MLRALVIAVLLIGIFGEARADVGWVEKAGTCQEFSEGVISFYRQLGDLSALSPTKEAELAVVLEAACGRRFAQCRFDICVGGEETAAEETKAEEEPAKERDIAAQEPSEENPQIEQAVSDVGEEPVGEKPTAKRLPKEYAEFDEELIDGNPITMDREEIIDKVLKESIIQRDPLAWLKKKLNCEEFKDQIRARYGPLGPFSKLPDATKNELQIVLDTACSPRFEHCGFRRCHKAFQSDSEFAKADMESESQNGEDASPEQIRYVELLKERTQAMRELRYQYDTLRKMLSKDIKEQIGLERKQGIVWRRFSVPEEIQRLSARRKKSKAKTVIKLGPEDPHKPTQLGPGA